MKLHRTGSPVTITMFPPKQSHFKSGLTIMVFSFESFILYLLVVSLSVDVSSIVWEKENLLKFSSAFCPTFNVRIVYEKHDQIKQL